MKIEVKKPFFSIIIPTRNRSSVVGKAIESVINQTFKDWEILVIDNDISDATRIATEKYLNSKIKYFRTGNLSMHDNWEYGIERATGSYITVLEDKAQFFPNSLEIIHDLITTYQTPIVCWDLQCDSLEVPDNSNIEHVIYSTDNVLRLFLSHISEFYKLVPRFLNSFCEASFVEKCKESNVGRVFSPYSPDFTSGYMQLAFYNNLIYVKTPLSMLDMKYSNGEAFRQKKLDSFEVNDFIKLSTNDNINEFCKYTPLKLPYNIFNGLFNDYLFIRNKLGGKLKFFDLDLPQYYYHCYRAIMGSFNEGLNIKKDMELFMESIKQQPEYVQRYFKEMQNGDPEVLSGIKYIKSLFETLIQNLVSENKTIALWGSGIIGEYLLEVSETLAKNVKFVVDSNSKKQHTRLTKWDILIESPSYLIEHPVDVIIIASLNFDLEIMQEIRSYKLESYIISASQWMVK